MQLKYCLFAINIFIRVLYVFNFKIDTNHPIVYEDVMVSPSRATYFGYSVVIHTEKEHWIQIGAPRANSSHDGRIMEPGIIYQCRVGETCDEVKLNAEDNERNEQVEGKTNAWIGVSMTCMTGKDGDNVVVCGHRWKDMRYENTVMMPGACYVIPVGIKKTSRQCKFVPLSDPNQYIKVTTIGNWSRRIYNTGLGQAGISSHCTKKDGGKELILGAPGVNNWKGGTVAYKIPEERKCGTYESNINNRGFLNLPVYFGYAVSSGHLFPDKGLVYAVSSPRASEGSGMVLLYEYGVKHRISPIIEITGTQLGEYFGASIATADINQDGFDDLIIGAPRYSTASVPDQGRIYIALGGEMIVKEMDHFDGETKNAQFGTTVAAVGDINNDGFEDIAVGAPYSNDYRGSVYIYVGGKNGLLFAQVIKAAEISSTLRGFGVSIHYTAETCKREKTYMAIGAYLSGHVAVLRSYPIISLHVQLSSSIKTIEKSDTQFSLTVCSWFHSACGPSNISITRNILLDPEYYRIHIQVDNGKIFSQKQEVTLQENKRYCNTFNIIIHEGIANRHTSIIIEASLYLNNNEPDPNTVIIRTNGTKTGKDTFCRNCSMVSQDSSQLSDTLKLPFSDCGNDKICNSELHLLCSFSEVENGIFVIGSNSELKMVFAFKNKKEPAYQTVLHVEIPNPVKYVTSTRNCHLMGTILHCDLNSPLDYNEEGEIVVVTDMSQSAEEDLTSITFTASLSTTSLNDGSYNNCTLDLKLKSTASMRIIGKSAKEVVPYTSGTNVAFVQTYQVYKVGPSPVRNIETIINVPHSLRMPQSEMKEFLRITQFEVTQGRYRIQCESDWPLPISSSNTAMSDIQELDGLQTELARRKRDLTKRLKRTEVKKDLSSSPSDKILYLNCTSENVFCQTITCTSGFTDSNALLNIKFTGIVNTSAIGHVMKNKNTIVLSTDGKVDVKEPKSLQPYDSESMDTSLTTISFVLEVGEKGVEVWVIVVSAICGVLLLLVVVFVLMKVGFFKREKKEALQKLLATTIAEEFSYQKKNEPIPANQEIEEDVPTEETCDSEKNE